VFLRLNSLSLIPFINHGKDGRIEKIFYYERHEIRENIKNTINPFHIWETYGSKSNILESIPRESPPSPRLRRGRPVVKISSYLERVIYQPRGTRLPAIVLTKAGGVTGKKCKMKNKGMEIMTRQIFKTIGLR
jgi:hypothetical protein